MQHNTTKNDNFSLTSFIPNIPQNADNNRSATITAIKDYTLKSCVTEKIA